MDVKVQRILMELNNLYSSNGSYGIYGELYDFLIEDGHQIDISKDLKDEFWKSATNRFNVDNKRWIESGLATKEQMTKELHKYYKSYLAAEYLLKIKRDTGQTLDIKDEQGNKLFPFNPKPFD